MKFADCCRIVDYPAVGQFSLSALKTLHPLLTAIDQQHLYATAARALATAKRRGDRSTVDYWSGKPISSIEVTPLPFARLPIEKPMSSLSTRSSNPILPKGADPFLYNPRRAVTAKVGYTVVYAWGSGSDGCIGTNDGGAE
jgi:hypothetical protein